MRTETRAITTLLGRTFCHAGARPSCRGPDPCVWSCISWKTSIHVRVGIRDYRWHAVTSAKEYALETNLYAVRTAPPTRIPAAINRATWQGCSSSEAGPRCSYTRREWRCLPSAGAGDERDSVALNNGDDGWGLHRVREEVRHLSSIPSSSPNLHVHKGSFMHRPMARTAVPIRRVPY